MAELRSFRFHPLERRGLLIGLGAGRLAVLGVGTVLSVVLLAAPVAAAPAAAVTVAAITAVAVWAPLHGRTPVEWVPIAASWAARRRVRVAAPGGYATPAGVTVLAGRGAPGADPIGVVADRRAGTWVAVLPVRGRALRLLDPAERAALVDAWGAALAATTRPGSPVHRVQWVARCEPGDPERLRRAAPPVERAGAAAYDRLLADPAVAGVRREVLLAVAVERRGAARQLRRFGRGDDAATGLLRRELAVLRGQLRRAEVTAGGPLDADALAGALRSAAPTRTGRRERVAWPLACRDGWASARVDGGWSVTYWVSEWPRHDVGPDVLLPLLLAGPGTTVALTMAPVPSLRAARQAESARTAELADEELRRRAGFLPTARHRRRAEGVAQREAELADGHGELRFSGYVTVTADDPESLEASGAAVEAAAQQAGLELRRLYGQQAEARTWTLPLARGLR